MSSFCVLFRVGNQRQCLLAVLLIVGVFPFRPQQRRAFRQADTSISQIAEYGFCRDTEMICGTRGGISLTTRFYNRISLIDGNDRLRTRSVDSASFLDHVANRLHVHAEVTRDALNGFPSSIAFENFFLLAFRERVMSTRTLHVLAVENVVDGTASDIERGCQLIGGFSSSVADSDFLFVLGGKGSLYVHNHETVASAGSSQANSLIRLKHRHIERANVHLSTKVA